MGDKRQVIGLAGATLVLVGAFAPVLSAPLLGSINYFHNGRGDGVILLVLAAVSVLVIIRRRFHWLWTTGLASMALLVFTVVNVQQRLSEITADMESRLEGNPFRGLAQGAIESVQIEWGWALLFLGAALLVTSAALKTPAPLRKCPHCAEHIQPEALVCKHCRRDVSPALGEARPAPPRLPLRVIVVTALLACGVPLLAWTLRYLPLLLEVLEEDYGIRLRW